MPVIAVVNRKGGSGKSTLATHLAAYCANAGMSVMLGDVDRQQSTRTWLRLRSANRAASRQAIMGWAVDPLRGLHAPAGVSHVILDTPGGLSGLALARVVMFADVILMPVCNSVFDRESAARCHAELLTLPRVVSGRCKIAAVGMRVDARTRSADVLKAWADGLSLPFVGVLRDTQAYVRCIENGMTLFDLPVAQVQPDLLQWGPILRWLAPVLTPAVRVAVAQVPAAGRALAPALCDEVLAQAPASSSTPVVDEPPVLTAVVQPATAVRPAPDKPPVRGALAHPPTLALRMRGLLGLLPAWKRMQSSAWGSAEAAAARPGRGSGAR